MEVKTISLRTISGSTGNRTLYPQLDLIECPSIYPMGPYFTFTVNSKHVHFLQVIAVSPLGQHNFGCPTIQLSMRNTCTRAILGVSSEGYMSYQAVIMKYLHLPLAFSRSGPRNRIFNQQLVDGSGMEMRDGSRYIPIWCAQNAKSSGEVFDRCKFLPIDRHATAAAAATLSHCLNYTLRTPHHQSARLATDTRCRKRKVKVQKPNRDVRKTSPTFFFWGKPVVQSARTIENFVPARLFMLLSSPLPASDTCWSYCCPARSGRTVW